MLSFAEGPSAAITPPNAITATSATLNGTVNANAAETTVTFEYGLMPNYGSSVAATQGTVSGTGETPVSATLTGLAPHTTYYYRITATNSNNSTSTAGSSFTTANTFPVGANDTFGFDPDDMKPSTLPVLVNDSDADGDVLTIVAVTQGAFGTVTTNGGELIYTPAAGFRGRDTFTYTVSDGFDTATAQVELRVTVPLTRALFSKGSEVPGAGLIDSGISAGSLFKSFGVPAINSTGTLAFTANYGAPREASELSILVVEPQAVASRLIARRGATAPGTQGARFASFKDPLLNDVGEVAFLASLSGGDATKRNNQGIWISASDAANSSGTELVARTGALPPGVSAGAQWKSFTSVAFSGVGADPDEGGWSLAFTGFMSSGAGGVKASNDMGLWIARPGKMLLALREAQKLTIDGTERQVRTFATLKPLPTASGQGNGVTSARSVSVQVFFTDGSQAMLRVSNDGVADEVAIEVLALTGDAVMGAEETIAKPGLPTQSGSGAATAWVGALSGKPAPGAIFERSLGDSGVLRLLARKGDENTGIDGAAFSAFTTVAVNDAGSALFLGKVAGKGTSSTSDTGLWWRQNSDDTSSLQLLAREGAQPPGTPAGTKWSAFTSLALPEGNAGPVFTAKLAGSKGMARQDKVSGSNDQGLWAVDSSGELQLVVREGQEVTADGSTTRKKVKSFTVLSAVPGSSAQRRSFDTTGRIVYRAVFTDGSQAVVKVQLP